MIRKGSYNANKYQAKRTMVDGISFHSKAEADRYCDLKNLQRAGEISNLKLQVKFPLEVNGHKVCTYIADFVYQENGKQVVADCKGMKTPVYELKKRLMRAVHQIEILELFANASRP